MNLHLSLLTFIFIFYGALAYGTEETLGCAMIVERLSKITDLSGINPQIREETGAIDSSDLRLSLHDLQDQEVASLGIYFENEAKTVEFDQNTATFYRRRRLQSYLIKEFHKKFPRVTDTSNLLSETNLSIFLYHLERLVSKNHAMKDWVYGLDYYINPKYHFNFETLSTAEQDHFLHTAAAETPIYRVLKEIGFSKIDTVRFSSKNNFSDIYLTTSRP